MKNWFLFTVLMTFTLQSGAQWTWHNPSKAESNVVQGQGWENELRGSYTRLPEQAKDFVRPPVWSLSQNSAGLSIHFYSNAPQIKVRYQVTGGYAMPHMPATGVSGVDMYARGENGEEYWCAGNYAFRDTIVFDYQNLVYKTRHGKGYEYRLYLPLYNSVKWLEIGVPEGKYFEFIPRRVEKPIVVYGTSIAQGACASRPGMAWPSIIERKLDRPVVNLGFSGNGKLEKNLIEYMNELDAKVYVLDCMPNMYNTDSPEDLLMLAVERIRKKHPETPILITEHDGYTNEYTNDEKKQAYQKTNIAAQKAYERLKQEGVGGLYYLSHKDIGMDMEAMVDGVHATDWGMVIYAKAYEKMLRQILGEPAGDCATTKPVRQRREADGYEWNDRHSQIVKASRENPPQGVVIGNSIVHYWGGGSAGQRQNGEKAWEKWMAAEGFCNMGCGWDRIENVLWRVYHDELDGFRAKKVILMIGTNNLDGSSDGEIVEGIRFLADAIAKRQPEAQLRVIGILPRKGMEERIAGLNGKIRTALPSGVEFHDVGGTLLKSSGKIDEALFLDGLHPNEKGYGKIAKKIRG